MSSYNVVKDYTARNEITERLPERSNQYGSAPTSDVYVWHYALLAEEE